MCRKLLQKDSESMEFDSGSDLLCFSWNSKGFRGILVADERDNGSPCMEG